MNSPAHNPKEAQVRIDGGAVQVFRAIVAHTSASPGELFSGFESWIDHTPKTIEWDEVCVLFDRLSKITSSEHEIEKFGALVLEADRSGLGIIRRMLGLVTSPRLLYRLIFNWAGNRTFPHIKATYNELPDGRIHATMRIPDYCRDCRNFFVVNTGNFRALPRVLGLPDAVVESEISERFHSVFITPPPSLTLFSRIARGLRALFSVKSALHEIGEQQQQITRQYADLQKANEIAHEQRRRAESAMERAERALIVKSEFIATMSHEVRTPLNGITGGVELLRDVVGDQDHELFEIVENSVTRLAQLVEALLDFSDLSAGYFKLREERFDVRRFMQRIVAMFTNAAQKNGLQLRVNIHEDVPTNAVADVTRVGQVLSALLDNAIKFTQEGFIAIEVNWKSEPNEMLYVSVQDTGPGIPDEQVTRIFQPFSQGDSSSTRRAGGTGLGLATCKRLAEALYGSLEVKTKVGEGSTFEFSLRARAADGTFEIEPSQTDMVIPPNDDSLRVLVVEDDDVSSRLLRRTLEKAGYRVDATQDGEQAVHAAQYQRYDIILMDKAMPRVDGLAATRSIRRAGANQHTPIIAVSAHATMKDQNACEEAGMNDFLAKPLSEQRLLEKIIYWRGRNIVHRALERQEDVRSDAPSPFAGMHALVVEDDAVNRLVLTRLLERLKFQVHTVENGLRAWECVSSRHFDVVLMDCEMPVMDGRSATRKIRSLEGPTGEIAIIAVTAYASAEEEALCRESGMNDFLAKPVKSRMLRQVLERVLDDAIEHPATKSSSMSAA